MASSSAPNIFSGSMSFSRETCRMTDGSIIIRKSFFPSLGSLVPLRPLKVESRHPNIAETDIINSAVGLINDREPVALDGLQDAGDVARRGQGIAARRAERLGRDGHLGLDLHAPAHEPGC